MSLWSRLLRSMLGRAETRAALQHVGVWGVLDDVTRLLPHLPPRDGAGEAASEAALQLLARASEDDLRAWAARSERSRWPAWSVQVLESGDPATLALAALHPDDTLRRAALARLEGYEDALASRIVRVAKR